jgi:hypothetical protein
MLLRSDSFLTGTATATALTSRIVPLPRQGALALAWQARAVLKALGTGFWALAMLPILLALPAHAQQPTAAPKVVTKPGALAAPTKPAAAAAKDASGTKPGAGGPQRIASQGFQYTIEKLPAWVDTLAVRSVARPDAAPWHYVLRDDQYLIAPEGHQYHVHVIRRINTSNGLQEGTQIASGFDPKYQSFALHELSIRRGGQVINKLTPKAITLLRREQGLEQLRYDGLVTVSMVIEDARVGDLIQYRYTVTGSNPVIGGRVEVVEYGAVPTTSTDTLRFRVRYPQSRNLRFDNLERFDREDAPAPAGMKDVRFIARDLPAVEYRANTPPRDLLKHMVGISEFRSWQEVADWGRELFVPGKVEPTGEVAKLVAQVRNDAGADPLRQAERALRFVQQDIRYFSILFGESSHRPTSPEKCSNSATATAKTSHCCWCLC